jgi:hypothetical protein
MVRRQNDVVDLDDPPSRCARAAADSDHELSGVRLDEVSPIVAERTDAKRPMNAAGASRVRLGVSSASRPAGQ